MSDIICPQCQKTLPETGNAVFCPFCGNRLGANDLLAAVRNEMDPVKKYKLLTALREEHPENPDVAEEILLLGKLYERGKRSFDFSIIKSYVLNVYLEPETMKKKQVEAMREEIFNHPDLDRCLALVKDEDAFMLRYLTRMSEEFIRLFLKGSTKHMRAVFGLVNEQKAPRNLALPAGKMLKAMEQDEKLTDKQRTQLKKAFYTAFARSFSTQYLDDVLTKYEIKIES